MQFLDDYFRIFDKLHELLHYILPNGTRSVFCLLPHQQ